MLALVEPPLRHIGETLSDRTGVNCYSQVTKMFRKWRCALQTATRQQQLVSGQLALRNSRMLKRSMERWQKFVRKCKAEKHSNMVRVARCFLEWKIKTEDKLKEKEREQQLQEKADRYYRLKLRLVWLHSPSLYSPCLTV